MKMRQIIGCVLMVALSIIGIILSLGISGICILNSDGVMKSMLEADYLESSEKEAREVFENYLPKEKVDAILETISVKSQIREIAEAFDNNTVTQVANSFKLATKDEIIKVLDQDISEDTKASFAEVVSSSYIKTIFPVTELSILSNIYNNYASKVILAFVILALVSLIVYLYLALGHKTYKWAIIALYNIAIINIIFVVIMGSLSGIVIGNERTTSVITNMVNDIKFNILIATALVIFISVISNYIAYFKKRKHGKTN